MTEQPREVKQATAGTSAAKPPGTAPATTAGEPEFAPQRGGWWVDVLIVVVIVAILLGGVGMAINDSELLKDTPAAADACPPGGCTKPPGEGCIERPIKGVVLSTGEHLYYVGTHPGYTGVIAMHTERGDRWFCSEETAAAAGFSPAP